VSPCFYYNVIVEKYKKCNKNNPLTPILKDEGGRMMMKNFILKERGNKSSHHQIPPSPF
jgi:hypothetical protein